MLEGEGERGEVRTASESTDTPPTESAVAYCLLTTKYNFQSQHKVNSLSFQDKLLNGF